MGCVTSKLSWVLPDYDDCLTKTLKSTTQKDDLFPSNRTDRVQNNQEAAPDH